MEGTDYYEILGIGPGSDAETIRNAINSLIRNLQVGFSARDKKSREEADKKLQVLLEARRILLDQEKRQEYDKTIHVTRALKSEEANDPGIDKPVKIWLGERRILHSLALLIDTSGSMSGQKITDAKKALRSFLERIDLAYNKVGIVSFGGQARVIEVLNQDSHQLHQKIDALTATGGTPLLKPLTLTDSKLLREAEGKPIIVAATDGHPDEREDDILIRASELKSRGTRIITIGIGRDVNAEFLKKFASSHEDFHFAEESFKLETIYKSIATGLAEIS